MTNSNNPEHNSNSQAKNRRLHLVLRRGGIALGGLVLVGLVGGAWRLWVFVHKEFTPLVAQNLTTTLNRPVKLGELQEISLMGVKFGASSVPATPTDPEKAVVDAVEVGFDPLQLLFNRSLKLDVTLVNPDAYLVQDEQGRWITTTIAPPGKPGPIKIELDKIRLRNAKVLLAPFKRSRVALAQLNGTAQFLDNYQRVRYDVAGQPANGGKVSIQGETRPSTLATNLQVQVQDFLAADVTNLIKLPAELQAGRVQQSNLQVQWQPKQDPIPLLFGSASVQGVRLQVPRLPQDFVNSQGNLRFQGNQIQLQNVTTSYGKVPLVANGILDTKAGFKLAARVNAVSLPDATQTLKLNLPLPVAGAVQADLQVTGPTTGPILTGTVASIKPAKLDKVDFNSVRSKFDFNTATGVININDIQATPSVGGSATGSGKILLGKTPQETKLNFNFTANNVPADAIAPAYEIKTPFQIGNVSATAQLTGTPSTVQTAVQWQAPNAVYPARGIAVVTPNRTVLFRNVALNVGGGTVLASGSWANQRYSAVADASQIQLSRFVNPEQLQNVSLDDARFNGRIIVSGTTGPFKIGSIRTENARASVAGGTVAVSNIKFGEQNFSAQLVADGVQVGRLLKKAPPGVTGPLAGTFQIAGNPNALNIKTLRGTGEARLGVAGGTVTASNIQLANGVYQARVLANGVQVQQLAVEPRIPTHGTSLPQGSLNGQFNVAGSVESVNPQSIQATGQAQVNVAGGTVNATNIQLANGRYQAQVEANNLQVQQLAVEPRIPTHGTSLPLGRLNGRFNVAGSVDSVNPQSIQATGQARLNVAGGTVNATNIQLANGRYQAQVEASNVKVQQLAQVPPQLQGALNGQFNVAGSVQSLNLQSIQATGQARLNNVAAGTVAATNFQLAEGRYQAVVDASGVQLNRLSQQLQGQFDGKLEVAGSVDPRNFASLQNIRATGEVAFSQGIAGTGQPLTAQVGWDGQKLNIERATSPDLNVSGYVAVDTQKDFAALQKAGISAISDINLNVQAQNYNLQKLPFKLPNTVALAGKADFNGQVTGKLPVPNVQGQLSLRDLAVNKVAFEPVLTGSVKSAQGQGLSLDIAGNRDRIAASLNANNRPESFLVRWQNAVASGQAQGENLALKVDNFPLAVLNIKAPPQTRLGSTPVNGLLTANLLVNPKTFAAQGEAAIAQPEVGRIKGDRLTAQFRYENGNGTLTSSEFIKGNSRYQLAGTFNQSPKGPQVKGKVNITSGQIQDVLAAVQLFDLQDVQTGMADPTYGKATDLTSTASVGLPNETLYTQLQRFSEIEALLGQEQQQRRDTKFAPDLADLKGTFNGEIAVDTTTATGLAVNFNLNGQNFVWGREDEPSRIYKADSIIAQGSLENSVLTLLPLRIESTNRLIAFSGKIGTQEQSGQLQVTNFPIQALNKFVKLPVSVTGNLNATATLAGNIKNPLAKGELQIVDGTLNQKKIDSATASFNYDTGRLNFGSNIRVSSPEPVTITGSIPYKLPFATLAPTSNELNLDVNVKNEGLALLNLFTNQVAFENGQGEVDVTVRGTLQQPTVTGIATLNNASFTAQALPGKLTDVTARALFDFDSVNVENLQGKFNQGMVKAQGKIPIFNREQTDNPLNVTLDRLAVNLKGLYQGGVSGALTISGSVLSPVIGGQLQVANGQVLLPASGNETKVASSSVEGTKVASSSVDVAGVKQLEPDTPAEGKNQMPQLNDLQLTLGKDVKINRPPLLSFGATGTLTVNGPLNAPVPEGTIRLRDGGINLFTTQFNLARGYKQTATFRANQPRDPDLNVRLVANVTDAGPPQVSNSPLSSSEINEQIITNIDPVSTVRVEARVDGPASQLNENLELTSNPTRSKTEIVALLGGSFVQTLGRGDSTLGLVNLAGSALNIQQTFNKIGNSLGLSEFRLFPTLSTNSTSNSSLDLAAELGVDLSRNFSISGSKVLTDDTSPPQIGINYRFNRNLRLRTSTDFSTGDPTNQNVSAGTRAVLEYEKRF